MSVPRPHRRPMHAAVAAVATAALAATVAACSTEAAGADADGPVVLVTTSVLGDIATTVLADTAATVEVIVPAGVDPHGYAPSAADGVAIREADLVLANGLGLEEALADTLAAAAADGVLVRELGPLVDPLPFGGDDAHGEGEHADEAHDDTHGEEEHDDEDSHDDGEEQDDHAHDGADPHVWLDPIRAGRLAEEIAAAWTRVAPEDADVVEAAAAEYVATMGALDAELAALVETVPPAERLLVTNHDALGYLAVRYDMTVIGTVVPGTAADVDTGAAAFVELAATIRETGVPAIFAETTASDRLAQALAEEVGGVEVVELYTGALGPPGSGAETLSGLIRTDVELIVAALG